MSELPMEPTLAETLADYAVGVTLDAIPTDVVQTAKLHALDAVGIAVASTGFDFGTSVLDAARRLGSGDESTAIGSGVRLPAAQAALVNGTLMHGLDFDDTHIAAIHHATAPVLATALAVGEAEDSHGASVLASYILGLEVGCRLAGAAAGAFHDRAFHPTGLMGTFASALVTGNLRGASAQQMTDALGLCGSQAAGILELRESWLKRLHPGWAAHAGIAAMTLGEAGFRGPRTVLEGDKGLYFSHLGHVPARDAFGLDDLGTRWVTSEIALKPYPCCHFTHAFIDAALALRAEGDYSLDQVVEIVCPTSERLLPAVAEPHELRAAPPTVYDALFSIQYAVALALVTGRVDLSSFYDDPLDDPEVLAIADKVRCPIDPLSDYPAHFPGEVVLRLDDGRELRQRVTSSYGTPGNLMSEDTVVAKFLVNATRQLPEDQAEALCRSILSLDKADRMSDVLALSVG